MNIDSWIGRASLPVEPLGESPLSQATGFVVHGGTGYFLITNRHVVTGLNNDTRAYLSADVPTRLVVKHRGTDTASLEPFEVDLFHEPGRPAWLEHPALGGGVDVVALPIPEPPTGPAFAYTVPAWPPGVVLPVTSRVSVVGFPQGISVGSRVAVWTTGFTASEIDLPVNGLPLFLIDAATREGQSGSPVVWYNARGRVHTTNGSMIDNGREYCELLGVYSGRERDGSTIGRVWRADVVTQIVTGGVPGTL